MSTGRLADRWSADCGRSWTDQARLADLGLIYELQTSGAEAYMGVDTFSIMPLGSIRAGRARFELGACRAVETKTWRAFRWTRSETGRVHPEYPGITGNHSPAQSARRCRIRGILIVVPKAEGDMLHSQFDVSSTVARGQQT